MAYELNVHPKEGDPEKFVAFAKELGWDGIALTHTFEDAEKFNEMKENIETLRDIRKEMDLVFGVEIDTDNTSELRNIVNKIREKSEIITVKGGNYDINRTACESSKVDILLEPDLDRGDAGLDEYCLKRASENDVTIAFSFRNLSEVYKKPRVHRFGHISTILRVAEKTGANVIITSNAYSKWDMRSPRELSSILNLLGMDLKESIENIDTLTERIVEKNRKKASEDHIAEGVEVLEDEEDGEET